MEKRVEDRNFVFRLRTSRKYYFPVYFMMLVLSIVVVYLMMTGKPIHEYALIGFVFFIVVCFIATELHRVLSYYEITSTHIARSRGIFAKDITRIYLSSVTDLVLKQSVWQRIFNFGTIKVHRFTEGAIFEIKNINNPKYYLNKAEKGLNRSRR